MIGKALEVLMSHRERIAGEIAFAAQGEANMAERLERLRSSRVELEAELASLDEALLRLRESEMPL